MAKARDRAITAVEYTGLQKAYDISTLSCSGRRCPTCS